MHCSREKAYLCLFNFPHLSAIWISGCMIGTLCEQFRVSENSEIFLKKSDLRGAVDKLRHDMYKKALAIFLIKKIKKIKVF